ncbi:Histone-lysine N-methyltransferase, H3 lysine-79 specific [Mycena sanguinolenta]|uniref:Histone-lysine N-methyltransferase, H3 lysine-79 specific n=1 Tax=Mycena sanguinolenta TaxID=230812 RepID=A0A8H6YUN5_9AGAR|nr:Histone-lysine N-methyltransferase, H3 lysine-79 specific [Mycena sanguinolenta]
MLQTSTTTKPDADFFSRSPAGTSYKPITHVVNTIRVPVPKSSPPGQILPAVVQPVSRAPIDRVLAPLLTVPVIQSPTKAQIRVPGRRGDKPRKSVVSSLKLPRRASSQQKTQPPSPEPIYRTSRSRSTSHFTAVDSEIPVIRRCWVAEGDGGPDPAHFSSENAVAMLLRTYCAYFKNLEDPGDVSFKPHPKTYPYVDLEYPNTGSSESPAITNSFGHVFGSPESSDFPEFILLAPKDKDHYNPIMDVEKTLYTIIECPPLKPFSGQYPKTRCSSWTYSPPSHRPRPRARTLPPARYHRCPTPLPPPVAQKPNYLRAVQRAIHRRDGPSFLAAFKHINALLQRLKYPRLPSDAFSNPAPNALKEIVHSWTETGMPRKVLMRIIEENYQRSVGPHVQKLKQYEAFSSAVYGELMPSLVHEILTLTGLTEDSLFLDLGSGVGNVVVQASLQTGCRSYGIELNPKPAKVAKDMAANFKVRCQMWGVKVGEIELEEGDMLQSARVNELIAQADVVLVDNKVFEQSLNEQLRPKFLDLKEGAYVVSLAPFVPSLNARVTERNVDDISAIFDVTERTYHSGSVSWGNNGGTYYIHRVDRTGYASIRERFESSRCGMGRRRRS